MPTPRTSRKAPRPEVIDAASHGLPLSPEVAADSRESDEPKRSTAKAKKPRSASSLRAPIDLALLKPKPYPQSDTSENNAITVLENLLDTDRIKSELQRRDKRPNTDGYFDLVDEAGRSKGQLDVQIKALSGNNLQARSYPCDRGLLGYCANGASRQVLLIGVDVKGRQAFWTHLSRTLISQLRFRRSSNTVAVKFPPENVISHTTDYHKKWLDIVEDHANRMHQLDPLAAKISEEEKTIALLIQEHLLKTDTYKAEFGSIQAFIDELNYLLDNEFITAKRQIYPNAWKVGIAYSLFSKTQLCYTLYPINIGHNEKFIHKVDSSLWKKIIEKTQNPNKRIVIKSFASNPMLDNPVKAARTDVVKLVQEVIRNRALRLDHLFLARELIFSVVDRFGLAFGLIQQDEYSVDRIANSFFEFLPKWVELALETTCPDHVIPSYLCGPGQSVNFEALYDYFTDKNTLSLASLNELIEKRKAPSSLPEISSARYPLGMFRRNLQFLAEKQIHSVQRPYIKPTNLSSSSSRLLSEIWLPNDYASNFKILMTQLVDTYNHLIETNFPLIQNRLTYFQGFDRSVTFLNRHRSAITGSGWSKLTYKLKGDVPLESGMDFYCEEYDAVPEQFKILKNRPFYPLGRVNLDEKSYKIHSITESNYNANFLAQPLHESVFSLLEERFDEFAENWILEDTHRPNVV